MSPKQNLDAKLDYIKDKIFEIESKQVLKSAMDEVEINMDNTELSMWQLINDFLEIRKEYNT